MYKSVIYFLDKHMKSPVQEHMKSPVQELQQCRVEQSKFFTSYHDIAGGHLRRIHSAAVAEQGTFKLINISYQCHNKSLVSNQRLVDMLFYQHNTKNSGNVSVLHQALDWSVACVFLSSLHCNAFFSLLKRTTTSGALSINGTFKS